MSSIEMSRGYSYSCIPIESASTCVCCMMFEVERFTAITAQQFDDLTAKDLPFVVAGADFGTCLKDWSVSYLEEKLPDNLKIIIHTSNSPQLSFRLKNFRYETENIGKFLHRCSQPETDEYVYLRSIGTDRRGKEIASLERHFPTISSDVQIPDEFGFCNVQESCDCGKRHLFSSVLRISSRSLTVWTHYDVMDNILLQICGRKRVLLFPPSDACNLYINGDKSEIDEDLDTPDLAERFPLFAHATKYHTILEEGDALFIPALWFHNTKALEFSIGVNFFWKDLLVPSEFYHPSDVYGNKDLIPANDANSNIDKALKHLKKLPEKYRNFYIQMIIVRLKKELGKI